jgi:hypothetical protein
VPSAAKRCIACVIAAVLAVAIPAARAAAAPAAPTVVLTYSPFTVTGGLVAGLHAAPRFGGTCSTGSFVVSSPAVFRCFAGDVIYDPCYFDAGASNPQRAVALCVAAPWATSAVRLRLASAPDPALGAPPAAPPWALRLASGRRCVFASGATAVIDGRRLNYVCDGRRLLFGIPDASAPAWRIRQARTAAGGGMRKVTIAAAWR